MAARELTLQTQFYLNYTHAETEHLEDDPVQQPPVVFLLFLVLEAGHRG